MKNPTILLVPLSAKGWTELAHHKVADLVRALDPVFTCDHLDVEPGITAMLWRDLLRYRLAEHGARAVVYLATAPALPEQLGRAVFAMSVSPSPAVVGASVVLHVGPSALPAILHELAHFCGSAEEVADYLNSTWKFSDDQ